MSDFGQKKEFPNTGIMFDRRGTKTNDKASDFGGDFEISEEVLRYVMEQAQKGARKVKLEIASWTRQGSKGMYQSLKIQTPYELRKGASNGYQDFAQPVKPPQQNQYAQATGSPEKMPWEI